MNPISQIPAGPLLVEQTRKVPAGQSSRIAVVGEFFRVTEADYGFNVGLGDSPPVPWDLGMQYRCRPGEWFDSLVIQNPRAVDVTVTVLIGRGEIADDRLNIVERRNGSASSNVPDVWRNAVPSAGDTVAVSNALVKIAEANPSRASLLIREGNGQGFYLCFNGTATQRPLLYAGSAQVSLAFKGEVWAIRSGGADALLTVTEHVFG